MIVCTSKITILGDSSSGLPHFIMFYRTTLNFYIVLYDNNNVDFNITYLKDEYDNFETIDKNRFSFGLTHFVKESGKPLLFKRQDIEKLVNDGEIELLGVKAEVWMGAPLVLGDKNYGIIATQNYEDPDFFDQFDLSVLKSIASQVSNAIYTKELLVKKENDISKAKLLSETSLSLSEGKDLKFILSDILSNVREIVDFDKATVQKIRGEKRTILQHWGFSIEEEKEHLLPDVSKDPIINRLLSSPKDEYLVIPDTAKHSGWLVDQRTKDVGSWIVFPLIYEHNPVGLITLDHHEPNFYTDKHASSLLHFTYQATIAIKTDEEFFNRQLDYKLNHNILNELNQRIDVNDILVTIVSEIKEKLDCKHCTVFIPEEKGYETFLKPQALSFPKEESIPTRSFRIGPEPEGIAGYVYEYQQSVLVDDAEQHPQFAPFRSKSEYPESMLVVPLLIGSRAIGIISANHKQGRRFNENNRRLIENIARYSAGAIERGTSLVTIEKAAKDFLNSRTVDKVIELLLKYATKLTHTKYAVAFEIGDDSSIIRKHYHPKNAEFPDPQIHLDGNFTRNIFKDGKTRVISNTSVSEELHPEIKKRFASVLGMRIRSSNRLIGVLHILDEKKNVFTKTEKSRIRTINNLAGTAISEKLNVNELNERIEELVIISKIGEKILVDDIKAMAQAVYNSTMNLVEKSLIEFNDFSFFLYDPEDRTLETVLWISFGKEVKSKLTEKRVLTSSSLNEILISSGKSLLINDYEKDQESRSYHPVIVTQKQRSFLGCPIKIGDEVMGTISLQSVHPNRFDAGSERYLRIISKFAAIAIKNKQLQDKLEERNESLKAARIKAEMLNRAKSNFFAQLSHELRNRTNSILNLSELLSEDLNPMKLESYVNTIQTSAGQLLEKINNNLNTYKIESGNMNLKKGVVDLSFIIRNLESLYRHQAQVKEIEFEIKMSHDTPKFVDIVEEALKDILNNLISNSIKFTDSGEITVSFGTSRDTPESQKLILIVEDTGKGVTTEKLDRILKMLEQTKNETLNNNIQAGSGLGLGLWITKLWVDLMQGRITFDSEIGKGTKIIIEIPISIEICESDMSQNNIMDLDPTKKELENKSEVKDAIEVINTRSLQEKFQKKVQPLWKELVEIPDFKDAKLLSDLLVALGSKHQSKMLTNIGVELSNACFTKNTEMLELNLNKLSRTIEYIARLIQSK
jgi:signal transduction histidine kinase